MKFWRHIIFEERRHDASHFHDGYPDSVLTHIFSGPMVRVIAG
jgi:hypothetical protein